MTTAYCLKCKKQVEIENPKECFKCGQKIGFKKLKSGKWMPVNAYYAEGRYMISVNNGNHHNSTVCHRCDKKKCKNCGKEYIERKGFEGFCSINCVKGWIIKLENNEVFESGGLGDYRTSSEIKRDHIDYLNRLIKRI